ncbi:MAG: 2-dehydro-3-deoxyphosphogluconate aldolase [Leifsonia sp.]|nr:2-dehydro-3-deoxyphosphogluconate aldolase [Leifsonia sp.]
MSTTPTGSRVSLVHEAGVLAVVRAPSADSAIDAAEALIRGGITGIEITFSTPEAMSVVAELRRRYGDAAFVGAGTVMTHAHVDEALAAGASFLVAPGTVPDLAREMTSTGIITMTGAMTPTEVMTALDLGVDIVKVFPASIGGPGFLRALREPFPHVALMPTGGVTVANLAEFLHAGAIAVGAGGDLLPRDALEKHDWPRIEERARMYSAALTMARQA